MDCAVVAIMAWFVGAALTVGILMRINGPPADLNFAEWVIFAAIWPVILGAIAWIVISSDRH